MVDPIGFLGGFEVFEVVYGKKRRELFLPSPGATDWMIWFNEMERTQEGKRFEETNWWKSINFEYVKFRYPKEVLNRKLDKEAWESRGRAELMIYILESSSKNGI